MTKEVRWEQGKVKIFTASNITVPETVDNKVFDKITNKVLNAQVVQSFSSTKEALFVPFNKNNRPKKVAVIDYGNNSSKAQSFKEAFQSTNMEHTTSPCPTDNCSIEFQHTLEPKWGCLENCTKIHTK